MHTDPHQKADILNNYFSSVFSDKKSTTPPTLEQSTISDIAPITIDKHEIRLLDNLNSHKATGPDNIPTQLLKQLSPEISPVLTMIFQAALQQCQVPTDWKTANIVPVHKITMIFQASLQQCQVPTDWKTVNIVPVHKKGNCSTPSNYQPISLTSVCCKLLEHIIYTHIFSHLNSHQILCDNQHGFRQGRSCETQLLLTIDDLARNLDKHLQTDVIFLDFAKAFDKVDHSCILHKLDHYGTRGHLLSWLEDFLTQRTQCVTIEGHYSSTTNVTLGVPQGSV